MRCRSPLLLHLVAGSMILALAHAASAAPFQYKDSPTSRCDLNSDGAVDIHEVQIVFGAALGSGACSDNLHTYDLNSDGWANVVDIQNAMHAAMQMGCSADHSSPTVTAFTPATGRAGQTVTITVTGKDLYGAEMALQSVDPLHLIGNTSVTPVSEAGTTASFSTVLGSEGAYNLIVTNFMGSQPASAFHIMPATSATGSFASVLNMSEDPASHSPLPAGQNAAGYDASVLNRTLNLAALQLPPAGQNEVAFVASVLDMSEDPASHSPLPAGQNAAGSDASVLNRTFNLAALQLPPAGQNEVGFVASVLDMSMDPASPSPLPAGQNAAVFDASVLNRTLSLANLPTLAAGQNAAAALAVSICNTASGCTAMAPATVAASASPEAALRNASSNRLPAVLAPLEERTHVTVGQTIRLEARNADPGSTVAFVVNQAVIATVTDPPYETLFTVPNGVGELVFRVEVKGPGPTERPSPAIRMMVLADSGAPIAGRVMEGAGGIELSLAGGGLKEEFFHLPRPAAELPALDGLEPVRTGYVTAINQPNPHALFGDDPLGAGLSPDYAVRFSGEVRAEVSGQYRFWMAARSGAALFIDGRMLADSGFVSGEAGEAAISATLDRGWHSLQVIYYLAVGPASVRLEWQSPGATRREVVGPEFLRTALAGMSTLSDADGRFAFPSVPTRFDSVWIRLGKGDGSGEFPAVKPGATQVSISVSK